MNVLLAIDESLYAQVILDFSLNHHWGKDVQFSVLTIVEPLLVGSYMSLLPSALLDELHEKAQAEGTALVSKVADRLRQAFPNSSIAEHVVEGFPKEGIIDFAKSWPADIIVVGSHGRRGVKRLLLGSVSQSVCAMAPCSVLVVRMRPQQTEQSSEPTILAAKVSG